MCAFAHHLPIIIMPMGKGVRILLPARNWKRHPAHRHYVGDVCNAVATAGLATLVWGLSQMQNGAGSLPEQLTSQAPATGPALKDAVIVFGSTGKLGRQIVSQAGAPSG